MVLMNSREIRSSFRFRGFPGIGVVIIMVRMIIISIRNQISQPNKMEITGLHIKK